MNHLVPSTCYTFLSQEPPTPSILSLEPTTLDILFGCDANATLPNEPPWYDAELVEADYKKKQLHVS